MPVPKDSKLTRVCVSNYRRLTPIYAIGSRDNL